MLMMGAFVTRQSPRLILTATRYDEDGEYDEGSSGSESEEEEDEDDVLSMRSSSTIRPVPVNINQSHPSKVSSSPRPDFSSPLQSHLRNRLRPSLSRSGSYDAHLTIAPIAPTTLKTAEVRSGWGGDGFGDDLPEVNG